MRHNRSILIIDDDANFRDSMADYLADQGFRVFGAGTAEKGLAVSSEKKIDLVLLDQQLPDGDGADLCPALLDHNESIKIIFITAYPNLDNAVRAVKSGAFDYLSKPVELEELDFALERAVKTIELEGIQEVQAYKNNQESRQTVLVGADKGLADVDRLIEMAAASDANVLVTGETGAGKNVAAKAIHFRSGLGNKPFISLNCAAIPETLIESELFGHEKGAFTGAAESKKGVFEMARGGTLFLDEIGSMRMDLQTRLLGVLEDRQIKRLGGQSIIPVKLRIIAASNSDLEQEVARKNFRQDLFYRLNVIRIHLPPLRQRKQDIPELCRHFIDQIAPGKKSAVTETELEKLGQYDWPGNVRELRNIIERALALQNHGQLKPSSLLIADPAESYQTAPPEKTAPQKNNGLAPLHQIERQHVLRVYHELDKNIAATSRALEIAETTLRRKLKAYKVI